MMKHTAGGSRFGRVFTMRMLMKRRRTVGGSHFIRVSARRRLMMKRRRTADGSRFSVGKEEVDDEV